MRKLTFFLIFTILACLSEAKVDPPNYNFSLDKFNDFMPGSSLADIQKIHGEGTKISEGQGGIIYRFHVSHIRYKFPVFVQLKGSKVGDFFARLPSYFLHDVFHQSLINRIGAQNKYYKKENNAVYIWDNVSGNTHIYSGSCTITCFPIYYAVHPKGTTDTLIKKMGQKKITN